MPANASVKDVDDVRRVVGTQNIVAVVDQNTAPVAPVIPCELPSGSEEVSERLNSSKPKVELPCDGRLLSTFAADLAAILKDHGIYQRGGLAFIVNQQRDGLEVVTPQMLRTLAEQHLVCFRTKPAVETELRLARTMTAEDAQGVLCAQQFLSRLPHVEKVATARLPVMREDGTITLLPTGIRS